MSRPGSGSGPGAVPGAPRPPLDADVIVVGGGPAGSATAWALARAGVDVLLLDRARFPRDKTCAEYLSPEASRILSEMGALDPVQRAGAAELTGMLVRSPNGGLIRGEFAANHGFRAFRDRGLALPRRELDAILLDRSRRAGARVMEGVRVTSLLEEAGRVAGVHVLEQGARQARALLSRLVVGADGLRSVVSRRLGLARRARWPRRLALVAHYRGVRGVGDLGEMHVQRGGYLGIAHVGGGVANVALVIGASGAGALKGRAPQVLGEWIAARPHLAERFARAERLDEVRVTGPFASSARRAWSPGAALVGDAADFYDPFTGEGIYAALRGGEMLAPYLIEALATPGGRRADDALAGYDAARRAEFGGKWKVERLVGLAVAVPAILDHAARVLGRRRDMADLLIGVAGDFVPANEVLRPSYLLRFLAPLPARPRSTASS